MSCELDGLLSFATTYWGLYIKAQTDIEVTSSPFLYSGGPILKQSGHDKRRGDKSDGLIVPWQLDHHSREHWTTQQK